MVLWVNLTDVSGTYCWVNSKIVLLDYASVFIVFLLEGGFAVLLFTDYILWLFVLYF